jgi:YggT family protein
VGTGDSAVSRSLYVLHLIGLIIDIALQVLGWVIIIDVILSYFPSVSPRNPFVMLIRRISQTLTDPFKKIVPPQRMGSGYIDFSPILALLAIFVLRQLVVLLMFRR